MLVIFLQVWGGGFYLLNKIFFSVAERCCDKKRGQVWRKYAWIVYLIGLPMILCLLWLKHNWMAFSVEAGGSMAMVLGIVVASRGLERTPKWLDHIALASSVTGIVYSLYDFGGITTLNQLLEIGTVSGFLIGTYLLAKERPSGYLWYMIMNFTTGWLMYIQDYHIMAAQQALSFGFIVDAYFTHRRKSNPKSFEHA